MNNLIMILVLITEYKLYKNITNKYEINEVKNQKLINIMFVVIGFVVAFIVCFAIFSYFGKSKNSIIVQETFGKTVINVLGVIVAAAALFVNTSGLKRTTVTTEKNQFDNTFFNLLTLLTNHILTDRSDFKAKGVLEKIREQSNKLIESKQANLISKYKSNIMSELLKIDNEYLSDKGLPTKKLEDMSGTPSNEIEKAHREVYDHTEQATSAIKIITSLSEVKNKYINSYLDNILNEVKKVDLNYCEKKKIVEDNVEFDEFGRYFRTVHRILKIINGGSLTKGSKNKYIGILRTQLSENELLLLFYNANYSSRGKKFATEAKGLDLWGTTDEVYSGIHFDTNNLVWKRDIIAVEHINKFGQPYTSYTW